MELLPCSETGWRWASAPLALPALTKLQVGSPWAPRVIHGLASRSHLM
jgi:hypothetical protein